jgi:leucyl aminopeptidase (aminopeptidase T)
MLQDEKMPGVHIAFGDPYASETKADYNSKLHVDALILKPDIFVDGKQITQALKACGIKNPERTSSGFLIMKKGKFKI